MKSKYLLLITAFFISIHANAQINTDRPDQTESSATVGSGNLQIESGFLIQYNGVGEFESRQILAPTNLFRFGLTEAFELRVLSQLELFNFFGKSIQGISDLQVGTKIQMIKNSPRNIEMAFLSHLIIPSGTESISLGEYGMINKLSISHQFDNIAVGYNIGYDYYGFDNGDLTYSLAIGYSVNDRVGIYMEPYGAVVNFEEFEANFDAGMTYLANENLQFDFSFGTGITDTMNYLSIGFSWLMHKQKPNSN